MTFTYPLDFPTNIAINDIEVGLFSASSKNVSPFSLQTQIYDLGSQRWEVMGSFPPLSKEDGDLLNSFLLKLSGRVGTFLMTIPDSKTPNGSWNGTPLVDGSSQTGNDLNVKGFTPSSTGVAKENDWISLGTGLSTRLYRVVEDADSDGSGNATIKIVPRLKISPSDNDVITFNNAQGLFRLKDPKTSYKAKASTRRYSFNLEFEEVI